MDSGGFTQLATGLYAKSDNLQVTARRRKRAANTVSVPAGGSAFIGVLVTMDAADTLTAPDAVLFDWIQAAISAASAPGVTLTGAGFNVISQLGATFPIGQPTVTLVAIGTAASPTTSLSIGVTPALWTSRDFKFALAGVLDALGAQEQPLEFQLLISAANSTAGAINVTSVINVFYRFVRGLQEG